MLMSRKSYLLHPSIENRIFLHVSNVFACFDICFDIWNAQMHITIPAKFHKDQTRTGVERLSELTDILTKIKCFVTSD